MGERWLGLPPATPGVMVVNASPLITLAKVGRIDVLDALCPGWLVPDSVVAEIAAARRPDEASALVAALPVYRIRTVLVPSVVLSWDLHAGENEVIALAMSVPGAEAILDDRAARRCALALGLRVCGTVGLLVRGSKAGIVTDLESVLESIRRCGLRLDDAVIRRALELASR